MILALLLVAELIPVSIGFDPGSGREMAILWPGEGKLVSVDGGLWASAEGDGTFELPAGRRIKRVWRFASTDPQSCVEGDLNVTRGGVAVFLSAPHNIRANQAYDGWTSTEVDYPTSGGTFSLRYVCRVTCGVAARCLFGLQLELQPIR